VEIRPDSTFRLERSLRKDGLSYKQKKGGGGEKGGTNQRRGKGARGISKTKNRGKVGRSSIGGADSGWVGVRKEKSEAREKEKRSSGI